MMQSSILLPKFDLYVLSLKSQDNGSPESKKIKFEPTKTIPEAKLPKNNIPEAKLPKKDIPEAKLPKKDIIKNNNFVIEELNSILTKRKHGNSDMIEMNNESDDENIEFSMDFDRKNLLSSMISSADSSLLKNSLIQIICNADEKVLNDIVELIELKFSSIDKKAINNEIINYNNINHVTEVLVRKVKDIDSIQNKKLWTQQKDLSSTLMNRINKRTFIFDHTLAFINKQKNRAECYIGKIPNIDYSKYIKNRKDILTNIENSCFCTINDCVNCNSMVDSIASKSCGDVYDSNKIPSWNMTFAAGALRSRRCVFYGSYKLRFKTDLYDNCIAKISISSIKEYDNPLLYQNNLSQEFSFVFKEEYKKKMFLLLRSHNSNKTKIIPLKIEQYDYNRSNYNDYIINWNSKNIIIYINDRLVYKSEKEDPIPSLPGYTHYEVFPNYDTVSYELLKNINSGYYPCIKIKDYEYKSQLNEI